MLRLNIVILGVRQNHRHRAAISAAQTVLVLSLKMENDTAVISYTGNPGQVYILQARDRMDSGAWANVVTNQPAANTAGVFRDADARNHATRFYRVATP